MKNALELQLIEMPLIEEAQSQSEVLSELLENMRQVNHLESLILLELNDHQLSPTA